MLTAGLAAAGIVVYAVTDGEPLQHVLDASEQQTVVQPSVQRPSELIPQTRTYYRWVNTAGETGYSDTLPKEIQSFRAIRLHGTDQ